MSRLRGAYVGEDVPVTISYEDSDDETAVDPDAAPSITITDSDGTTLIDGVAMTSVETGVYEYVWDTAADANGAGDYQVDVSAEFSSETKIERITLPLK